MKKISIALADKFLSRFSYVKTTLQVLPESSLNGWPKVSGTTHLLGDNNTTYSFDGNVLSSQNGLQKDLLLLQKKRYAVYFMVNGGDGVIHSPHKTCRSSDSVITLNACFVDTDEGDINNLLDFCRKKKIKPHMVVLSSKTSTHKKYHVYFLLKPTPKTAHTLRLWTDIQNTFSALDKEYDSSMKDVSKVLRIPGFYHIKDVKNPCLVKVVNSYNHPSYDLEELHQIVGVTAQTYDKVSTASIPLSLVENNSITTNMHNWMKDRVFSYAIKGVSAGTITSVDDILEYIAVLEQKIDLSKVRPTHKKEMQTLANDAYNVALSKIETSEDDDRDPVKKLLDWTSILAGAKKRVAQEKTLKSFELDKEIYLSAPGLLGEITRYIHNNSRHPMPSASFCAALTILSSIKGLFYRSDRYDWCSLYTLCLAPSGSGKSDPMKYVSNTLTTLGLSKIRGGKIASTRSIMEKMKRGDGQATFLFDEMGSFLEAIQATGYQEKHYQTQIRDLLLDLFTRAGNSYDDPATSTRKEVSFDSVLLNLMGATVLSRFEQMFSVKSITDGLLQRMLIFIHTVKSDENTNNNPACTLPEHIMVQLRELAAPAVSYNSIDDIIKSIELEIEAVSGGGGSVEGDSVLIGENNDDRAHINEQLQDLHRQLAGAKVQKSRQIDEGVEGYRVVISYDSDAATLFAEFRREMLLLERELAAQGEGLEALASRAGELVGRICTIAATTTITIEIMEYVIGVVRTLTEMSIELCKNKLAHPMEAAMEKVHTKLCQLFVKNEGSPVPKRQLQRSNCVNGIDYTFREVYREMVELGTYFEESEVKTSSGQKSIVLTPITDD